MGYAVLPMPLSIREEKRVPQLRGMRVWTYFQHLLNAHQTPRPSGAWGRKHTCMLTVCQTLGLRVCACCAHALCTLSCICVMSDTMLASACVCLCVCARVCTLVHRQVCLHRDSGEQPQPLCLHKDSRGQPQPLFLRCQLPFCF